MMNSKGQTLIAFIIFIPIIIIIAAILVDSGLIVKEKNKLQSITEMIAGEIDISKEEKEIDSLIRILYKENDIDTSNLKVNVSDNSLEIDIRCKIDSIFGSIIGKKTYEIKGYIYSFYNISEELRD